MRSLRLKIPVVRGQISNPISPFEAISRLLPRKLQIPNKNAVFQPFLGSFTRLLSYTKKMCVAEFQRVAPKPGEGGSLVRNSVHPVKKIGVYPWLKNIRCHTPLRPLRPLREEKICVNKRNSRPNFQSNFSFQPPCAATLSR
jgi:hypothetical protein